MRCEKHAYADDMNLVEKQCQMTYDGLQCPMIDVLNDAGICSMCAVINGGKTPRLFKQREVVQFLREELKEFPMTSVDKIPEALKGCGGKERPDILYDLPDRIVIIEIDEDQHQNRPCQCEQTRMINISQALGSERTFWIRFNPDSFKSTESRKFASKHKRYQLLRNWLITALTKEIPYCITVLHLFFDDFTEGGAMPVQLM